MAFKNLEEIKQYGFVGFKKVAELSKDSTCIPKTKGIYCVLYLGNQTPEFVKCGTGGYYKGKNPNILIKELENNWVSGSPIVYIGQTKRKLHKRIKAYLGFGQGKAKSHWGGRLIWQLKDSNDLVVCWKELPNEEA